MAVDTSNKQVFAGTSNFRYTDPLSAGKADAKGLYPWTAFRARVGTATTASGGAFTNVGALIDNTVLSLLLFTSDIPAIGLVVSESTAGLVLPSSVSPAASVSFLDATVGGSDLTVKVGEVGQGYVGTIECSGFPATSTLLVATGAVPLDVVVVANGGVVNSPISFLDYGTASTASGYLPIILRYSDYTAAIRDAGNVYTTSAGLTYQVVGLYTISAQA